MKGTHPHLSDVFRARKVNQVSVIKFLSAEVIAVLAWPQITSFNSVSVEKLLICNTKSLTNGLCNGLSLKKTHIRSKEL